MIRNQLKQIEKQREEIESLKTENSKIVNLNQNSELRISRLEAAMEKNNANEYNGRS